MEDDLNTFEHRIEWVPRQVRHDERGGGPIKVFSSSGREVIDYGDRVAVADEPGREVRADETSAPGDESLHCDGAMPRICALSWVAVGSLGRTASTRSSSLSASVSWPFAASARASSIRMRAASWGFTRSRTPLRPMAIASSLRPRPSSTCVAVRYTSTRLEIGSSSKALLIDTSASGRLPVPCMTTARVTWAWGLFGSAFIARSAASRALLTIDVSPARARRTYARARSPRWRMSYGASRMAWSNA